MSLSVKIFKFNLNEKYKKHQKNFEKINFYRIFSFILKKADVTATTPRAITFAPSGVARCTQPLDVGFACDESTTPVELYHFSTIEEFCVPFEYLGCGGNGNQFDSFEACDLFCSFQGHHRPTTSP